MYQGPPQNSESLEKLEFKVLRPGDVHTKTNAEGKTINYVISPQERMITTGGNTLILLMDLYKEYFVVAKINADLKKRGIGTRLYEEALKLARAEGKKGLASAAEDRTPDSERRWEHFKKEGRVNTVNIGFRRYDVLLC